MICNLMMTKNVNALKLMKKETVLHRLLIANEEMQLNDDEDCECIEADEEGNCVAQTADRKRRNVCDVDMQLNDDEECECIEADEEGNCVAQTADRKRRNVCDDDMQLNDDEECECIEADEEGN